MTASVSDETVFNGHAGFGQWEGDLQVREFKITEENTTEPDPSTSDAVEPTISKQPADVTCKAEEKVTLTVEAKSEDEGTLSYQWYSGTENDIGKAGKIEGADKATYEFTTDKEGTTYYYCKVTNTNDNVEGNKTAEVDSKFVKVTVTKAMLTVRIDKEKKYAGKYGNLFYYNKNGKMEFVDTGVIDDEGDVSLIFTHASDSYVLVISDKMLSQSDIPASISTTPEESSDSKDAKDQSPKTGDNAMPTVWMLCLLSALVVIASLKKREEAY